MGLSSTALELLPRKRRGKDMNLRPPNQAEAVGCSTTELPLQKMPGAGVEPATTFGQAL